MKVLQIQVKVHEQLHACHGHIFPSEMSLSHVRYVSSPSLCSCMDPDPPTAFKVFPIPSVGMPVYYAI